MTAPSYTTDLNDIATADESSGWAESSSWNDGSVTTQETDYYIQGSYCVSSELKITKSGYASLIYNYASNLYSSFGTDYVVLAWFKFLGPNVLDTDANGGIYILVGSALNDFNAWNLGGSESYKYGGWINIVADPTVSSDRSNGSPSTTNYTYFGVGIKEINPINKGNPFGVDAIRYGRAAAIFEYGETDDYCTFEGFAAINDANDATDGYNRWGLIQAIAGGYLWKGLMTIGTGSNAADFRDSNVNITLDNTTKVSSTFNAIEVNNTDTRLDWIAVNIISLSTVSPGHFTAVNNAEINMSQCNFSDMGRFAFGASTTLTSTSFIRCDQVNQNEAILTNCNFNESSAATTALFADDIDSLDGCTFSMGASTHAIELSTDHAGNSYTLTNVTFTGYATADGSDGDEAIYNNSGGAVTINISGGTTPSIRNGTSASTNVVSGSVDVTVTVQTATGTKIQGANVFLAADASGPFPHEDTVTITNSGTTATVSHSSHDMATNDKVLIQGASLSANNGVYSIAATNNTSYTYTMGSSPGSNPTGTILSTYVLLKGTTDVNGQITMSRSFSADQPIYGWARKSSAAPYYKEGPLSGTVDKDTGAPLTAILAPDGA